MVTERAPPASVPIPELYASVRPFVSGQSYANYCDLDLDLGEGYAKAYWGDNLPRLMKIKAAFYPKNIFRHAQSVPVESS